MKKLIKRLIGLIIFASLCVGGFYTAMGYGMYRAKVAEQSIEDRIERVRADANYTQLADVPEIFIDAIISVEDSRFYKHSGVDIVALTRAMTANIRQKEFVQGGSTISQQFAKNLLFSHDQNLSRKIAELFATNYIEKNYEKDEILEAYINVIYYGDGYYNIREASMGYFGVEPNDLTPYQATMLAGIPNAPSVYAPTKNLDLAQKRQDKVLDRMVESGAITQDEMNEILKDRR
ncbi:MAG: transglycosylase domain-containing protein [Clostridia bacterium]|nr:transglycosylase domain-containing protein [Clostridia bacterium]